jgi:Protein of unknown function (DUF1566)
MNIGNISVLIIVTIFALGAHPISAETTANGPYYAAPSWDQTLPASTRFVVLSNFSNAAVLDRETGLVWEQSPSTTTLTWESAQVACLTKNVGGRRGWKLPSIQELASLVDPTASSPELPAGHPFTNVQSSDYWSATTSANSDTAWVVFFNDGFVGGDHKSITVYVWCVRGGPGGDVQ